MNLDTKPPDDLDDAVPLLSDSANHHSHLSVTPNRYEDWCSRFLVRCYDSWRSRAEAFLSRWGAEAAGLSRLLLKRYFPPVESAELGERRIQNPKVRRLGTRQAGLSRPRGFGGIC